MKTEIHALTVLSVFFASLAAANAGEVLNERDIPVIADFHNTQSGPDFLSRFGTSTFSGVGKFGGSELNEMPFGNRYLMMIDTTFGEVGCFWNDAPDGSLHVGKSVRISSDVAQSTYLTGLTFLGRSVDMVLIAGNCRIVETNTVESIENSSANGKTKGTDSNPNTLPPARADGLTDRKHWEQFFSYLTGDRQNGALWWSSQRSLKHPGSCSDLPVGARARSDRMESASPVGSRSSLCFREHLCPTGDPIWSDDALAETGPLVARQHNNFSPHSTPAD